MAILRMSITADTAIRIDLHSAKVYNFTHTICLSSTRATAGAT
uniref:Uncharacterized protein n=1 Tax=Arundo donax TaxID=35708 RepID=A0A0A9G600_ARUDO